MKLLYLVESGKSKFLVFDEMPDKISTKYGDDTIIGRIGGIFYDFLAKRNERREAFGGRKFDVVLDNGEVEKCGRVMGEHYYNKFVHEFDGNILKMVGYFRGSEKEGQVFCDMITERIEKYEKRMSYDKGKLNN